MNHPDPEVTYYVVHAEKLPPSKRPVNSIIVTVDTRSIVLLEDRTTGARWLAPGPGHPPPSSYRRYFNHCSLSDIQSHIHNNLDTRERWLCVDLASKIATEATRLGCDHNNGFSMTIKVKITYKTVTLMPNMDMVNMIISRMIDREELKSLRMEPEPCSICFEDLFAAAKFRATRMICSHIFHCHCLLTWLDRRNTCPLCRTLLYDL